MFRRSQPKVEVLARVPADDLPWRHEGVLVLVSKGVGALRWRAVKANGATKRALVLRDTPLLFAQSPWSNLLSADKQLHRHIVEVLIRRDPHPTSPPPHLREAHLAVQSLCRRVRRPNVEFNLLDGR